MRTTAGVLPYIFGDFSLILEFSMNLMILKLERQPNNCKSEIRLAHFPEQF